MNNDRLGLSNIPSLTKLLGHDLELLQEIIANKPKYYGSFFRTKANGNKREITPPRGKLLAIQYSLKRFFNSKLVWTKVVHGGIANRSIATNATPHIRKRQVVNIDISSFFPSVTPAYVQTALLRAGCSVEVAPLLTELLTYKNGLPQGSPTSTIIGNLVLEPMDSDFMALCKKKGLVYTRYVDDVTISGGIDMRPMRGAFIDIVRHAGFTVAEDKLKFTDCCDRQVVTGLVVNNRLRPTKEYLAKLKRTIRRCWPESEGLYTVALEYGLFPGEFLSMLKGQVGFVKSVDCALGRNIKSLMVKIEKTPRRPSVSLL